jgi:hypothetical protein
MPLGLQPILFEGNGAAYPDTPGSVVVQYAVVGLPSGKQALIRRHDGHWQTLQVVNDVPGAWCGTHKTLHLALASLEAQLDRRLRPL